MILLFQKTIYKYLMLVQL